MTAAWRLFRFVTVTARGGGPAAVYEPVIALAAHHEPPVALTARYDGVLELKALAAEDVG